MVIEVKIYKHYKLFSKRNYWLWSSLFFLMVLSVAINPANHYMQGNKQGEFYYLSLFVLDPRSLRLLYLHDAISKSWPGSGPSDFHFQSRQVLMERLAVAEL